MCVCNGCITMLISHCGTEFVLLSLRKAQKLRDKLKDEPMRDV